MTRAQLLELVELLQARGVGVSLVIQLPAELKPEPTVWVDEGDVGGGEQPFDFSAYVGKRGGG